MKALPADAKREQPDQQSPAGIYGRSCCSAETFSDRDAEEVEESYRGHAAQCGQLQLPGSHDLLQGST